MRKISAVLFSWIIASASIHSQAQIINTVAGNDTATHINDGLAATQAYLQAPLGVCVDMAGNLYIADEYNNRIRKVNTSGVITTVAGNGAALYAGDGGAAIAASLNSPTDVAVDAAGNIYIADMGNECIRKVNTSGIIHTYAGNGTVTGYSGDGGSATSTTALLNAPFGITLDASGNLYIADNGNSVIRKVTTSGIISTVAGSIGGFGGDGGPATAAKLNQPTDIAVDGAGNMYIADYWNNRIRKVNTLGVISTVAGNGLHGYSGDGGQATAARLSNPKGIAVSPTGVLYIVDSNFVMNVYPTGIIYRLAGSGPSGNTGDGGPSRHATLGNPYSGALDTAGNFYFGDYWNNKVRKTGSFHNHAPLFSGGHSQTLSVCRNSTLNSIDTVMQIFDVDSFQTENWMVLSNPAHGSVIANYTASSTASIVLPLGLSYSPTTGYSGTDSFKIVVTDGISFDTTTVHVSILTLPTASMIAGADSVCLTDTIILSDSTAGGIWSSSNTSVATVNPTGIVTGLSAGSDSIVYTVTNICGSAIAYKAIGVKNHPCPVGTELLHANLNVNQLLVFPNPNTGTFTLQYNNGYDEPAHLTIYDLMGNQVKSISIITGVSYSMDISIQRGLYHLNVETQHGTKSAKLIIE